MRRLGVGMASSEAVGPQASFELQTHLVARDLREHSGGMLDDPLCPKTVVCDTCQQIAVIEIIHVGDRKVEKKRGETTHRIPLTINCPKCGRHRQPWRE